MDQPVVIAPAHVFNAEWTTPGVRLAFVRLENDETFRSRQTLREQVLYAKDFFEDAEFDAVRITNAEIARFLGIPNDAVVSDIVRRGDNDHMKKGRIPMLTEKDLEAVSGWIAEAVQIHKPLTLAQVAARIEREKHKVVTTNSLQKTLTRAKIAKTIIAFPEEAGRLMMNPNEIARYTTQAVAQLNNVPAAFVFNMDETGINVRANSKAMKVLVDFNSNEESTKYAMDKNTDHATLVACIAADGTATKPLVIITQATIRERLIQEGWTRRKAMFAHTESGYINQALFRRWIDTVLVPDVERRRAELEMPDHPAFLIMDNCTAHTDQAVTQRLEAHGIVPLNIPPHGSHIYQPLDRVAFSSFKAMLRSAIPIDADSQTTRLIKILESWEKATKTRTITGSFKLSGFRYHVHDEELFVTFDPEVVIPPLGHQIPTEPQPRPVRHRPATPSGRRLPIHN